ncbi:MAG: tRNA nucleotidyltransferase [Conexibacter sp.]|nr:tRNA nucleotidyltransferase [Conexibacter sp.]
MHTAAEALEALRALPCGARLLDVLAGHEGAWLVGGVVRDALLGRISRDNVVDLDVVVEGDPEPVARALGEIVAFHERFGTYDVVAGDCFYDVVRARAERYAAPGALPDVVPSGLEDDLLRRDFTINALALNAAGALHAAPAALEDLQAGRLRVLHAASFRDDPTRLWRLVRYAVRLGFAPEPGTERVAVEAVRAGALDTVSGDRLGAELRLALGEQDPLGVLHAAQNLGVIAGLDLDPARVAGAVALLPAQGARADLTLLGAVIRDGAWAAPYGFTAAEQHILDRCAELAPVTPGRPSEITARLRGEPVEAVAVAGAKGDPETAGMYLHQWRHVRLEIDGHDLLAAGVAEGPDLGRRLAAVLARRLDGDLAPGREAELAAALDGAA